MPKRIKTQRRIKKDRYYAKVLTSEFYPSIDLGFLQITDSAMDLYFLITGKTKKEFYSAIFVECERLKQTFLARKKSLRERFNFATKSKLFLAKGVALEIYAIADREFYQKEHFECGYVVMVSPQNKSLKRIKYDRFADDQLNQILLGK